MSSDLSTLQVKVICSASCFSSFLTENLFHLFSSAVQQTRTNEFEKGRKRHRSRQPLKGDIRREADFVSLSDFVYHLQAVEPYQRPPETKSDTRSIAEDSTAARSESGSVHVATKLPAESTTEIAARLLFMSIHWAKNVRHFAELSHIDQVSLLQENWCKIFVINLVQWAMPFELAPLVADVMEKTASEHVDRVLHNMGKLNEVVFKLVQLGLNRTEFTLLKALVLFNPGKKDYGNFFVHFIRWASKTKFVSSGDHNAFRFNWTEEFRSTCELTFSLCLISKKLKLAAEFMPALGSLKFRKERDVALKAS